MQSDEKKKRFLRMIPGFIRKDFVRKLIAFVLAAIIYVAVLDRLSISHEIPGVEIPINPPSNFVVIEKGSPAVRLTVTGSQSHLKRLKPEDFTISDIEIKPEKYKEGQPYILELSPSNFHGPLGVTVVSVSPEILRIDIDKLETKELPVKAEFDLQQPLPAGYKIDRCIISPEKVRVTAPAMILKTMKEVKTTQINLDNMTSSFDINKDLVSPSPDIKISPQEVGVRIDIVRNFEEKTFTDLEIDIARRPTDSQHIELESVKVASVTLSASGENLHKLSMDDISIFVPAKNLTKPGTYTVKLNCSCPGGINIVRIIPETVKVTVK
ncbi:MAG: hypothetical protein E7040_04875 [Lentisphaerae bacterium]|nr:hypothetical protein [Lentisphaerota bacterium]